MAYTSHQKIIEKLYSLTVFYKQWIYYKTIMYLNLNVHSQRITLAIFNRGKIFSKIHIDKIELGYFYSTQIFLGRIIFPLFDPEIFRAIILHKFLLLINY